MLVLHVLLFPSLTVSWCEPEVYTMASCPVTPSVVDCCRTDEQLFSKARLIITALMARIHTVEWTTAIVQHPAGRAGQVNIIGPFS